MCVCVCVCMYVAMYICMYVCVYVCIYLCMYVCIYVCMYVQTLPDVQKLCSEGPTKVQFAYLRSVSTHIPLYLYKEGSPVKIKSPAHRNLISCSMTALPHALSPSSALLPPHSMHFKSFIISISL
jgi:hypothetical protein